MHPATSRHLLLSETRDWISLRVCATAGSDAPNSMDIACADGYRDRGLSDRNSNNRRHSGVLFLRLRKAGFGDERAGLYLRPRTDCNERDALSAKVDRPD